jgi:pimeloyl-ACP methyl ester carboxylesterase
MPEVRVDDSLTMHYEDDYFGEPWLEPQTVMMVHGVAESGLAWSSWVPHFARRYRVLRPDQRGFGQSTVPAAGYHHSPEKYATDLAHLLDALGIDAVHVIGAKIGGSVSLQFAASYPERTRSLTVISGPVRSSNTGGSADLHTFGPMMRTKGIRGWAAETMRARLGSEASEEQIEWWTDYMARTDQESCISVHEMVDALDISAALPAIKAPTLIMTTQGSALASVNVVREWQQLIPDSELQVIDGDSYHVAAVRPDECAERTLEFIGRRCS